MNWAGIRVLRGANVWTIRPMLEVELDLTDAANADLIVRALGHLWLVLPESETAGGDVPEVNLAWALGQLTLALQRQVGSPVVVALSRLVRTGVARVAIEFEEEALGVASLAAARRLCLAALRGEEPGAQAELASLRELAHEVRLGPSTEAIVAAAKRQGIPALRLNDGNLVQLGHGASQRRIWTAETDRTGSIAEVIAQDKDLTRHLLRGVGVSVPDGRPVRDADDAWEAAEEVGPPVVVKPRYGNHGRGVATGLLTREQVARAFSSAREYGDEVVVERFVVGNDYRLLVIGDRLVAAALRQPPRVVGDGRSTVAELVAALNRDPRRSDGHATALSLVKLDVIALAVLAGQGHTPDTVPIEGEEVFIRRNANLSSGGTATDVTDQVHPRTAASVVAAARAVGLDIAGVDVVAPGIDQPLQQSGGAVIEVNAGPGLRMHLEPSTGGPRPVGEAIIQMLFPGGGDGRIPTVAVLEGVGGTARLLAHLLAGGGHVVGVADGRGLHVGGRRLNVQISSNIQGVRAVLLNPRVTAAVLAVDPGTIQREGLGFDRCDVVVARPDNGNPGPDGVESSGDRTRVGRAVVRALSPAGAAVLDAADPLAAETADACPGSVVYYARDENLTVTAHLAGNGRAVLVRAGQMILARGSIEEVLLPLGPPPSPSDGGPGFTVEDALASVGAAWALGLPAETIRTGLATFVREP